MSESYTIGGDTLALCNHPNWQGQTFSVREDHVLDFVDLQLRGGLIIPQPVIQIFHAGLDQKPWGTVLSRNRYITEKDAGTWRTGRVRFSMQPVLLSVNGWYVIIVANFPGLFGSNLSWQYDNGDGNYPRGCRISSNDGGVTWSVHFADDFLFAEFGNPPLPEPEPPPPINKFATLAIAYTHWDVGLTIRLATSVPCDLTCYYTSKVPLKHHTSRTIRGLKVPWWTYFCFVGWRQVRQIETGDTLYHTFDFPTWHKSHTKYLTFRGQVDLVDVPSVGPIFKHKHTGGLPRYITLRPDAPGDLCTIPRQAGDPCPDHWKNVDEVIADEDNTWVGSITFPGYNTDLYNLPNLEGDPEEIAGILHYARFKARGFYVYLTKPKLTIKTWGFQYSYTIENVLTWWNTWSCYYTNNPFTGNPWTRAEVDNLQLGPTLQGNWGYRRDARSFCTQTYAILVRKIQGGPDP